jgi:hypothetical protein
MLAPLWDFISGYFGGFSVLGINIFYLCIALIKTDAIMITSFTEISFNPLENKNEKL